MIFLFLLAAAFVGVLGSPMEERLQDELFRNYHKYVVPTEYEGHQVSVQFGLDLMNIGEVVMEKEEIDFHYWAHLKWNDYRLRWDPKQYNNITILRVPGNWIWKPDITVFNAANQGAYSLMENKVPDHPQNFVYLWPTGNLFYIPPVNTRVRCKFENAGNGAFLCRSTMGSWSMDAAKMDLQLYEGNVVDLHHYRDKNWRIINASIDRKVRVFRCCPNDQYPYMEVNITMKAAPKRRTIL